jgi:hypothetical protein
MSAHRLVPLALWFVLGSLVTPPIRADEANKPDELFEDGKALLREGRYAEACAKLSESFQLDPATGTLLALALCQERWGKLASARASYREAALRAHSEQNAEREEAATRRAKELEPRLSKLTILVPQEAARITQLTIRCNGEALSMEAWGTPVAVDGGSYLIEASAPGRVAFRVEVTLAADGDLRVVTIPPLATRIAPRLAQRHAAVPPRKPERPNEIHASLPRILSYATGGSAVLAFGLGTFFGLQAKSRNDESNSDGHCTGKGCDQAGFELRNQALSSARASTVSFAMGAALSIASVSLYLGSEPDKPRARVGTRVNTDATSSGLNVTVFGEL